MSNFAELFPNSSAAQAKAEMVEALEANVEGWVAHKGGLDEWISDAVARLWSILMAQASVMGSAALGGLGKSILNVPPILAAPAVVMSTWTAIDDDGHTIEDGTEVKIAVPGGEPAGFVVVGDVIIAPGDSATAAGEVLLQAIIPGVAGNGLSADPTLVSSLAFIDAIELEGVSANGVDEEDEDEYLGRLTERLQLLSETLVEPKDLEIDARSFPGAARALCVPGYDNETEEEDVPLCLSEFVIDDAGVTLGPLSREALQEAHQARVPSGVQVFVGVPTTTPIHAVAAVTALSGYDPASVKDATSSRAADYLSPASWPLPSGFGDTGNSAGWVKRDHVYLNDFIAELDRVAGVERVSSLLIGSGAGKAFVVAAATDKLTSAAHGFSNGDMVILRTGLVPGAPLIAGAVYFVRDVEVNTFKLAATAGGVAINITGDGGGKAVKVAAADIALPGIAPLVEPGEIVTSVV